jgi:isoleucyl-tRNA synthetase
LFEEVAKLIEEDGIDAWFELDASTLLGDDAANYDKVMDTLDVWFDSGVTHAGVLERRDYLDVPADLYLEGSDQHRGWFQSSLLAAVAMRGEAPYKQVMTHGFTVDGKGMKMSKSKGNVIPPQKVCNSLGADILRLWVASADYTREMSVSDEILKRMADSYRRIRNTTRFLLANLSGFDPAKDALAPEDMLALDRWVVDAAARLQEQIIADYDVYNFHSIYQAILNFCSVELGSFYLDVIKDRQYTMQTDSRGRRSCQTAVYHVLEALTRWFAPILSFTADEVWEAMPGERGATVFIDEWYEGLVRLDDSAAMAANYWQTLLSVRQGVSKQLETLRKDGDIGSSLQAEVALYVSPELKGELEKVGDELRFILLTSTASVELLENAPADAVDAESGEVTFKLLAKASSHEKCVRCWHYREDVGVDASHPELCGRCVENVAGDGEAREFA